MLKDEQNCSYNGGGDAIPLKIMVTVFNHTVQYTFDTTTGNPQVGIGRRTAANSNLLGEAFESNYC